MSIANNDGHKCNANGKLYVFHEVFILFFASTITRLFYTLIVPIVWTFVSPAKIKAGNSFGIASGPAGLRLAI